LRSLVIGKKYQVSYCEKRGKGTLTVIGIRPSASFVSAIHKYLNIPIHIYSHDEHVKPALFKGDDAYYAILINLGDHSLHVPIDIASHLLSDGEYSAKSLRESISVNDSQMEIGRFYVELPRMNGTVIKIQAK